MKELFIDALICEGNERIVCSQCGVVFKEVKP